jgi:hypothetical protein
MARLSKTQQERNARLKALITHVPEGTDIAELIFAFVLPTNALAPSGQPAPIPVLPHPAGDRHAAIACAAAIEHGLKQAITRHLAEDASSKGLFDDFESALGSFSARTAMARALGIIDDSGVADLDIIRRIRNTFAHSVLPISFGTPDIAFLTAEIKRLKEPIWDLFDAQYTAPRDRYVVSCAVYYASLLIHKGPPRPTAVTRAVALAEAILASPRTPPLPRLPATESESRIPGFDLPPLRTSQD